jgi:hypothetical protein
MNVALLIVKVRVNGHTVFEIVSKIQNMSAYSPKLNNFIKNKQDWQTIVALEKAISIILQPVACLALPCFSLYLINGRTSGKKKLLKIKCVLFSL